MCSGAREHKCWNGATFDGPMFATTLSKAIYDEVEALPAFEPEFLSLLQDELATKNLRRTDQRRALDVEADRIRRELENILGAIRNHGSSSALLSELKRLEREQHDIELRRGELEDTPRTSIEIPTIEVVKRMAREALSHLSHDSQEFARLMRKLAPSIFVFPHRICDGGRIALRASLTFTATPLIAQPNAEIDIMRARLQKQMRLDLFTPPQREAFREQVVRMRQEGLTERAIAAELEVTQTAVQRAASLQRLMDSIGITDPWIPLHDPPIDCGKLRRHLHKRYQFEPLDGFPRRWLD